MDNLFGRQTAGRASGRYTVVGRTNLMILCLGLFACVALSLLMQHIVGIKDKKDVHPALTEIHNLFGDRLQQRPTIQIEDRGGRRAAVLCVRPKDERNAERLANTLGRYLLHFRGEGLDFDSLDVLVKDAPDDPGRSFPVAVPPRLTGRHAEQRRPQTGRAPSRRADANASVPPSGPPRGR